MRVMDSIPSRDRARHFFINVSPSSAGVSSDGFKSETYNNGAKDKRLIHEITRNGTKPNIRHSWSFCFVFFRVISWINVLGSSLNLSQFDLEPLASVICCAV
jgi:hypothetical protein